MLSFLWSSFRGSNKFKQYNFYRRFVNGINNSTWYCIKRGIVMKSILRKLTNKIRFNIVGLFCVLVISSGCAVGMATSGEKKVRTEILEVGQSRLVVEEILGRPVSRVEVSKERRTDVYEFEVGDESSTKRAWLHGIMDVMTLTLWEIPAGIYEASQGKTLTMRITYGSNDRVIEIGEVTEAEPRPQEKGLSHVYE